MEEHPSITRRRRKILMIGEDRLFDLMRRLCEHDKGTPRYYVRFDLPEFPADVRVDGVYIDAPNRRAMICLWSSEFEPVPDGLELPQIEHEMEHRVMENGGPKIKADPAGPRREAAGRIVTLADKIGRKEKAPRSEWLQATFDLGYWCEIDRREDGFPEGVRQDLGAATSCPVSFEMIRHIVFFPGHREMPAVGTAGLLNGPGDFFAPEAGAFDLVPADTMQAAIPVSLPPVSKTWEGANASDAPSCYKAEAVDETTGEKLMATGGTPEEAWENLRKAFPFGAKIGYGSTVPYTPQPGEFGYARGGQGNGSKTDANMVRLAHHLANSPMIRYAGVDLGSPEGSFTVHEVFDAPKKSEARLALEYDLRQALNATEGSELDRQISEKPDANLEAAAHQVKNANLPFARHALAAGRWSGRQ